MPWSGPSRPTSALTWKSPVRTLTFAVVTMPLANLAPILLGPEFRDDEPRISGREQDHELDEHLDRRLLIRQSADALTNGTPVRIETGIRNTERAVGTMLGHEVTLRYGEHAVCTATNTPIPPTLALQKVFYLFVSAKQPDL